MRYFIWTNAGWTVCQFANELPSNWLEYQLRDGTIGLSSPKNWKYENVYTVLDFVE